MPSNIPVFYTIGAYNPWTGDGNQKWTYNKQLKQAVRRRSSALEDDEVIADMLLALKPGRDPLCSLNDGLGLVLGILPWGDYAVLIPSFATRNLNINFLPSKHLASEFLSLSPMYLTNKADLVFALKGGKERRSTHRGESKHHRWDDPAQLNAIKFAAFEHARVFYYNYFKGFRPADLGVPSMFSWVEPKIVVLQFNFFQPRVHVDDMEEMLLDAAWGVVDFPSKSVDDIVYVSLNKVLNNPGRPKRAERKEGKVLNIDTEELSTLLRDFLLSLEPSADIILLTHDIYNLSRALCHLGLDDLYPQARVTTERFRRWQSVLNDGSDWEGVGALVGYPERIPQPVPQPVQLEPKPDPDGHHKPYDARGQSAAPSSPYASASPWPEGGRESSVRSAYSAADYGDASQRSDSVSSDRYEHRADREYSAGPSVKHENYEDERERSARSETPLFRPPSRSPSVRPTASPSSSRFNTTPLMSQSADGEDVKINPLEDMPDIKPFAVKEEEQKRSFASNGFAGAPRRTFALDTQVLYATSGRLWTERRPLHRVAVDMGLHEADDGICAANELIDIWNVASRILSGPPIFFVKGYIEEDVRAKKAEEEYYKLEEQGRGQDGGAVPPGGVFGAPPPIPTAAQYASKPKGDFYDDALADDDDW